MEQIILVVGTTSVTVRDILLTGAGFCIFSCIIALVSYLRLQGFQTRFGNHANAMTEQMKIMAAWNKTAHDALGTMQSSLGDYQIRQTERQNALMMQMGQARDETQNAHKILKSELAERINGFELATAKRMHEAGEVQKERLATFSQTLDKGLAHSAQRIHLLAESQQNSIESFRKQLDEKLNAVRKDTIESLGKVNQTLETKQAHLQNLLDTKLNELRIENSKKLEEMRVTVDEKLQSTLEKRLGESFKTVSERLEQVHQGLGEMKTLATGVGDLKRVLTNVKTRGGWGEVQLGTLSSEILTQAQYEENVAVVPDSNQRVEFAVRIPASDDSSTIVYLPIDAKFPQEDYQRLVDAAEIADKKAIEAASKGLERSVRSFAKDIAEKYISPPHTTDFGILFLPTEGLYAEIARRAGLIEELQRSYRIVVAGPTTFTAILSSLQMGFRTMALQKRSTEVWQVLAGVKTEFSKFGGAMDKLHKRLEQASKDVEVVQVRTRSMGRKLRDVETLPDQKSSPVVAISETGQDLDPEKIPLETAETVQEEMLAGE